MNGILDRTVSDFPTGVMGAASLSRLVIICGIVLSGSLRRVPITG